MCINNATLDESKILLPEISSDLESSAKLLEDLTSSRGKDKDGLDPIQRSLMNLRGQLQAAEAKVKALEEACTEAEEVRGHH
jgi:hypothetical protein